MKKTLAAFLIFTAAVFMTAETGYRGVEWGMSQQLVAQRGHAQRNEEIPADFMIEAGKILDTFEDIYYYFLNDRLISISYVIPLEKENELMERIENSNRYTLVAKREWYYEPEVKQEETKDQENKRMLNVIKGYSWVAYYGGLLDRGKFEAETPSNFKALLFDYNDDTCVQINIDEPENKILVMYHAAPQDF